MSDEIIKTKDEIGELFDISVHEIRTHATKINWIFGMLIKGQLCKLSEENIKIIKSGYDENHRLLETLKDVDIAYQSGKWNFKGNKINISDILKQVINEYIYIAKLKKIKFNIEISEDKDFFIMMNAWKLKFSIRCIIDNAIKYNIKNGKIKVSLKREKNNAIIKVEDTGLGIPKKDIDKIFDKSFRARNIVDINEGAGIGLSIIKKIIEREGGEITIESEENKFTISTIILPLI